MVLKIERKKDGSPFSVTTRGVSEDRGPGVEETHGHRDVKAIISFFFFTKKRNCRYEMDSVPKQTKMSNLWQNKGLCLY